MGVRWSPGTGILTSSSDAPSRMRDIALEERGEKPHSKRLKSVWKKKISLILNHFIRLRGESGDCVRAPDNERGPVDCGRTWGASWAGHPHLSGCLWPGVEEEAGREGDLTLPLGSSPEQLALSGKQSQESVEQDPNHILSRSNLTDASLQRKELLMPF